MLDFVGCKFKTVLSFDDPHLRVTLCASASPSKSVGVIPLQRLQLFVIDSSRSLVDVQGTVTGFHRGLLEFAGLKGLSSDGASDQGAGRCKLKHNVNDQRQPRQPSERGKVSKA